MSDFSLEQPENTSDDVSLMANVCLGGSTVYVRHKPVPTRSNKCFHCLKTWQPSCATDTLTHIPISCLQSSHMYKIARVY